MFVKYASSRLACNIVDDVHMAVHGPDSPNDADWSAYLAAAREILVNYPQPRVLVYTLGGNPSSAQRSELNKINEGLSPRVAVMLNSRVVRGTVTALSWFNPSIKAFTLGDIAGAMTHLELDASLATRVGHELDELRRALKAAR